MNELLKIREGAAYPIDGRELHKALGIETQYTKWFERMCEYGFSEKVDYQTFLTNRSDGLPGKPQTNHSLTLSMAKELCMIQRSETGRKIRRYLIEVENAWNSPEKVMARALKMADERIGRMAGEAQTLEEENLRLRAENRLLRQRAQQPDDEEGGGLGRSMRDMARRLGVNERAFIRHMIAHKYVQQDKSGALTPYVERNDVFEACAGIIANYLAGKPVGARVCAPELWREAFEMYDARMDKADASVIRTIMNDAPGWERARNPAYLPNYGTQRYWQYRPEEE